MDRLACPSNELWEERRGWFESLEEEYLAGGGYIVSEQACALAMETQLAFCSGAWLAVIILAMAVVDAQLREAELPGFEGSTKNLIESAQANPELQKIRRRRNALIHVCPDKPAISVDQQWENRPELEEDARKAVRLMFESIFMSPWI